MSEISYIHEEFHSITIKPSQLDNLLANGWRHFGTYFFRYNLGFHNSEIRRVFPLRICLDGFSFSKSQRRILRRNADLQTVIRPIEINTEKEILFERHKQRFKENVPFSIHDFLSVSPATVPCEAFEVEVFKDKKLLAVSFFDVGSESVSSIYAMFEPTETLRSLGIFTMLCEINYAIQTGKKYLYQGYVYEGNSFYDYKKRFRAVEKFDWRGNWGKFEE